MNKKALVFFIMVLSLSTALSACRTSSPANTASDNNYSRNEPASDTDTNNVRSSDTDSTNKTASLIDSDSIKELNSKNNSSDSDLISSENLDTNTDINSETTETTDTELENQDEEELRISPNPSSIELGGITLEAKYVPFDTPLELSSMERIDSTFAKDTLYILDKKTLHRYTLQDDSITALEDIALNSKYEKIDSDVFGNIYMSNSIFNPAVLNPDGTLTEVDSTGKLAMSKVMDFGLSFDGKEKISPYNTIEYEDWQLENISEDENSFPFSKINDVEFVENHILVGGIYNDGKEKQRAAVYDYDGNLIALTDNKIMGDGIDSLTETDHGLIAASVSNLSLWNTDGSEIGQTKSGQTAKLFGTDNPVWINDVFAMDDSSVLALCTCEREDGKYEALLYKLWGF